MVRESGGAATPPSSSEVFSGFKVSMGIFMAEEEGEVLEAVWAGIVMAPPFLMTLFLSEEVVVVEEAEIG